MLPKDSYENQCSRGLYGIDHVPGIGSHEQQKHHNSYDEERRCHLTPNYFNIFWLHATLASSSLAGGYTC